MTVERFIASKNPSKAQLAMQEMLRDIAVDKSYSKMMRLRLRGDAESECHDVYYTAMDGDRAVSRHWMGWGKHANAIGNWGNFLTIEEYRGKGIGGSVLKKWWDDLHSPDHCPLPLGFLCTAGNTELTRLYSKFGFRPAIDGRDYGPLYMPLGNSPATFSELCEEYYQPSDTIIRRPAAIGWRHEIDCLLRFYFINNGEKFGIDGIESVEELLVTDKSRAEMLFTPSEKCVGWAFDGKIQLHPIYRSAMIIQG